MRVRPADAMSVADVVKAIGLNYTGMSFSQACAIALSSLLETMREHGKIPRREGYEYNTVMEPFGVKQRTGRKLDITRTFSLAGGSSQVPALAALPPELKRARIKFDELDLRSTADPLNFSQEDREELQRLAAILYPPA